MYKYLSATLLMLSFIALTTLNATQLDWGDDYNKALEQAKQEQKIVYLFIGADRCKYCKKFKEITLLKPGVKEHMQRDFVLLYLSRDRDKIPQNLDSSILPAHYFLSSTGEVIRAEQGVWDIDGWYTILDEVISERGTRSTSR